MDRARRIRIGLVVLTASACVWTGWAFEGRAQTARESAVSHVVLQYADEGTTDYSTLTMSDDGLNGDGEAGDRVFGVEIPNYTTGSLMSYLITYERSPLVVEDNPIQVGPDDLLPRRIVINEFMASNTAAVQDPQEEFEDWIELLNVSEEVVNLSGMYLSDSPTNLKKWKIPEGVTLDPGGFLIIWADEDGGDEPGLHANFRLSRNGESILLVDSDERGNSLVDEVTFSEQQTDISYGRYPDGGDSLRELFVPTPGTQNLRTGKTSDFDGDGSVAFQDFLQFAQHFGSRDGDGGFDSRFDLDDDGDVGFSDFLRFAQDFGTAS